MQLPRRELLAILTVALFLRVWLIFGGGQFYWPDEGRYEHARKIIGSFLAGDTGDIAARLDGADHVLFKIVALVPASIETAVGTDARVPALFFAICSVVNIWLVGRIAAALGAGRAESVAASALCAMSSTLFYYSRHLLPYDLSMMLALAAMDLNVRHGGRPVGAAVAGALAGCAFLTYSGYWTLGGAALLLPLACAESWRARIVRAAASGAGLVAVIGTALGISHALGGRLAEDLVSFSAAVNQGAFEEGWRLPFEYLWHAEHGLLLVWAAASGWALWRAVRRDMTPRIVAGLAGALFVYAVLTISSVWLERFVVYGRLARQFVPFLCLLGAAMLVAMRQSPRGWIRAAAAILLLAVPLQAALNFVGPLRQSFPAEFVRAASREHESQRGAAETVWVNTAHIYPRPGGIDLPPRYDVIREARHPLEYLPYQYEGYTPQDRESLRAADLRMRLLVPRD